MKKHLIALAAATILVGMTGQAVADNDHHHKHGHKHHDHHHHKQAHKHRDHGHRGGNKPAYAKVVAVKPIIRTVTVSTPRQTCWDEEVVHRTERRQSAVPTVVGGVVGGVIGHQVGHGKTRNVATVAGAVVGAAIGNEIGQQRSGGRTIVTTREQCRTTQEHHREERIEGYWVTYRYKGKKHTTRMDEHPGETIRVSLR